MKTILTTFAIATLALLGAAPEAQAKPCHKSGSRIYVSSYRSCGTPVYSERYFVGYNRCGDPVWGVRTVRQPSYYRPVVRPTYVAPCPPPYQRPNYCSSSGYRRPYSGSSIVVQGYFGR